MEGSRSNLLPQSEYFNTWTALLNVTLSPNATTSPEGLLNATKLVEDSATAIHRIYQIVSITSGQAYTQSVFAKEGERRYLQIAFGSKISGTDYANFDLQIGEVSLEVGSINATIEPYGNGWYRCSATSTANVTSSEAFYYTIVESGSASRFASYSGDGTSGAYIFGAQLEANYATSYIPTYGVSQTRASDVCKKTGISSLIGQTEGTLYFEGSSDTIGGSTNLINFNFSANSVVINRQSTGAIRALINTSSAIVLNSSSVSGVFKVAIAYKNGDSVLYVNGALADSSTNSFTFATALTEVNLGTGVTYFALPNQSKCNQALVFKTRLSNAELATLTTI